MESALKNFEQELSGLRTGRATSALVGSTAAGASVAAGAQAANTMLKIMMMDRNREILFFMVRFSLIKIESNCEYWLSDRRLNFI